MKLPLLVGFSFFLVACVQVNPPREVSSEEQASIYLKIGVRYLGFGQLEIAKEKLEKSVDLDSSNGDAHNALAVLYERIQRPSDAKYHYQRAISEDEEKPQPQNNYGRFLCDQGEYEEGLAHLAVAFNMPLNSRKWISFTNAGLCYLKQNKMREAENYFRKALEVHPQYPPALLEMLKMSYRFHKFMSARAFVQRYFSVSPESADSLWYAYRIELGLKNQAGAEAYRTKLLTRFPDSKEARRVE